MKKPRFALIGDGYIAKYHRRAIEHVGGQIEYMFDPKYGEKETIEHERNRYNDHLWSCDYFVICSPSHFHRQHIQLILENAWVPSQIICEKPAFLPWEPIIDSSRINICLQLRYMPNLPKKADLVTAHFLRDHKYFWTWKGDAKKTGGIFYNIWIHYLDLAILLDADFEGSLNLSDEKIPSRIETGNVKTKPIRRSIHYREQNEELPGGDLFSIIDLQKIDMQQCYNNMYDDIIGGGGIKPKDTFYLSWVLSRNSEVFGYGRNSIGKLIEIKKELL